MGFDRVEILDGKACGIQERRLILCFIHYQAEDGEETEIQDAVIHPYYPVSQRAFRTAQRFVKIYSEQGLQIRQANEIHIKHILNRLPFLQRGRNTLSYLPECGSRFHVQILATEEDLPVTSELEAEEHPVACGKCRKCAALCPGGAITENGFEKEKCLRFWMMNGKMPPKELAVRMGNRLLGCDVCEACCPMNRELKDIAGTPETVPLKALLSDIDLDVLTEKIGRNYAIRNRVLTQACIIAGSLGRKDLTDQLQTVMSQSASPVVRQAAAWALKKTDGKNTCGNSF